MSRPYAPRRAANRWGMSRIQVPSPSSLDRAVAGFRDRWETDGQYRTRMSVVVGVGALIFLCIAMAIAATVGNLALGAGNGSGTGGQGSTSGGPNGVIGVPTFPTATVSPWTPLPLPGGAPAPNSGTPPPSATKVATATPGDFATPTPGGPVPTTCNGISGSATWALTPCPQVAGQSGTLAIYVPGHARASLNVIVLNFGICANNANCTFTPSQSYKLDSSAQASIPYTVPAEAANNTAPISGLINVSNGPSLSILAAPVK
jgi:hypothetical protein